MTVRGVDRRALLKMFRGQITVYYSPCKVLDPDSLEHPPRLGVEDGLWMAARNLLEVGSIILGLKIPEDEALHLRKLRKYFL